MRLHTHDKAVRLATALAILAIMVVGVWGLQHFITQRQQPPRRTKPDFSSLKGFCDGVSPIQPKEYLERQARLAQVLEQENAAALIVEPGPTMLYYTNIAWSLSERPFLVVLQRNGSSIDTTVVTPMFEATRAYEAIKDAQLPAKAQPIVTEWIEHESPYMLVSKVVQDEGTVFVEPNVRLFVYDGIAESLGRERTHMASRALQTLRMIKSPAELDILRCVNRATEAAIRAVRPHVQAGMTEEDIANVMEAALHTAGLTNTWVLALVDENAAFPHGEPGKEKRVTDKSTVLIDTGGELLGYQSDTTRTFFVDGKGHNSTIVEAWHVVKKAQESVLELAKAGTSCANVDLIARNVIDDAGYGKYFTHRLGHGIGEEMHEEPYVSSIYMIYYRVSLNLIEKSSLLDESRKYPT